MILGLALRGADVERVSVADDGVTSISRLPSCRGAPSEDGDVLGFDVYAVDEGDLQPWVRRPGAVGRLAAAGLAPNGCGLFDSVDTAIAASDALAREGGDWFAWRLTAYALAV